MPEIIAPEVNHTPPPGTPRDVAALTRQYGGTITFGMNKSPMNIGLIGCGKISGAYFKFLPQHDNVRFVACADLDMDRAKQTAEAQGLRPMTPDDLVACDDVDIVLNLTIPDAHALVNLKALDAGKHAYCEKPLGVTMDEGHRQVVAAREANLRLGCAPDTFLGGGIQTARKALEDGVIGQPLSAVAFLAGRGMETWHPSPVFYYKPGGGPVMDMGPYYFTALVNLFGPATHVAAMTKKGFAQRTITSEPLKGQVIDVEVDTHATGTIRFANDVIATTIMSFDVQGHNLPRIEVYGTKGTLVVPDPNTFKGPVKLLRAGEKEWAELPLTHSVEVGRGLGVADLAAGVQEDRPHRASGDLALHVLEIMTGFDRASEAGRTIEMETTCERPAVLPMDTASATS